MIRRPPRLPLTDTRFPVTALFLSQYDETDDSHQHMEPFRDVAEALQKEFSEDDEVQGVIAREQSLCKQWALENVVEDQSPEPRSLTIGEQETQPAGARGVFDDVDASRRRDRRVFPGPLPPPAGRGR